MGYRELYEYAQTLEPAISRADIRRRAIEITGVPSVRHVKMAMDPSLCRGMYLAPGNVLSPIRHALGMHVIVTARDLNYCWERFVFLKELMHVFGTSETAADTGDKFEYLLNEFSASSVGHSAQMTSELDSFWMGLALLCPEGRRREFAREKAAKRIQDGDIAEALKMPLQYVPLLFGPRYETSLKRLLGTV